MTHTSTEKPEALRFAEMLDKYSLNPLREASAELRRQHDRIAELEDATDIAIERIEELEEQLSAIGAGGVEPLRKQAGGAAMKHHTDDQDLLLTVLSCPHTVTHESITLRFNPKQEGYNALAQLRHRLAAADAAAKAREMELLAVIEDLERLIDTADKSGGTP